MIWLSKIQNTTFYVGQRFDPRKKDQEAKFRPSATN